MKLSKSGASHFKQGTTKWYISMKLHYFEGCPGAFFIPAIKSLPTYFLFITAPSSPSPNVWVSTHLNTWKPSCLLRQRKPASCRIWNVCSQDRGEFRPAWLPVAKQLGTSQGGMWVFYLCLTLGQHWTSNRGSTQQILAWLSFVT